MGDERSEEVQGGEELVIASEPRVELRPLVMNLDQPGSAVLKEMIMAVVLAGD